MMTDKGCAARRLLLLGTAPAAQVEAALAAARAAHPGARLRVLARACPAGAAPGEWAPLAGRLTWRSGGLLRLLATFRPHAVVLVCGDAFWHEEALAGLRVLSGVALLRPCVLLWLRGAMIEANRAGREGPSSVAVLAVLLAGVLWAGLAAALWQAFAWPGPAGLVAATALGEALPRLRGRRGRASQKEEAVVVEHSSFQYQPHAELGWTNAPGAEGRVAVRLADGSGRYEWTYRHDAEGRRETGGAANDALPLVAVYGCSYTYGATVSDAETYAFLLQRRMPGHRVSNRGVGGYSPYQALLAMERDLPGERPEVVVFGFYAALQGRNTMPLDRALSLPGLRSPWCASRQRRLRRHPPQGWLSLPGAGGSALLAGLERAVNAARFFGRGDARLCGDTMRHVLLQMRKLCADNGAALLVLCLDAPGPYAGFLHESGFNWEVCVRDMEERLPGGLSAWRLLPFDAHPNAAAHERYAEAAHGALLRMIAGGRATPDAERMAWVARTADGTPSFIYTIY